MCEVTEVQESFNTKDCSCVASQIIGFDNLVFMCLGGDKFYH